MESPAFNPNNDFALRGRSYRISNHDADHIRDLMNEELPSRNGARLSPDDAITLAVIDLDTFHVLMADALRSQRFSEAEATLIVEACRGWWGICPWEACGLWHELNDYLEIRGNKSGDFTTRPKWQLELVKRLRRLSPLEALAVVRAAQRVWSLPPEFPVSTALVATGLVTPEPHQLASGLDGPSSPEGAR